MKGEKSHLSASFSKERNYLWEVWYLLDFEFIIIRNDTNINYKLLKFYILIFFSI